jgi:hypothetical protein
MNGPQFVADLIDAMPTPQARLLLTACLAKYAGMTVYLPAESKKARRIRAAENMLRNHMTAADAATALVERFRVSMRTAQRDVETARHLAQKSDVSHP